MKADLNSMLEALGFSDEAIRQQLVTSINSYAVETALMRLASEQALAPDEQAWFADPSRANIDKLSAIFDSPERQAILGEAYTEAINLVVATHAQATEPGESAAYANAS